MDEIDLRLATIEDMVDELSRRGISAVLVTDRTGDRRGRQLRVIATDDFQPESVRELLRVGLHQIPRLDN